MKTKKAIFMMGGPAAGKSHVRGQRFPELNTYDSDEIKMEHPDYDPQNPSALHDWSAQELHRRILAAVTRDESFVYDGTGSTAERYVHYFRLAQEMGFEVCLVYVRTSLKVAIERNQNRERTVPENVVREKHAMISTSFEIISAYADSVEVVNN